MDVESWIELVNRIPNIQFVPIDNELAIKSTKLPGTFHNDPADRMIVSTSIRFAVPLITSDKKILEYPYIQTISN